MENGKLLVHSFLFVVYFERHNFALLEISWFCSFFVLSYGIGCVNSHGSERKTIKLRRNIFVSNKNPARLTYFMNFLIWFHFWFLEAFKRSFSKAFKASFFKSRRVFIKTELLMVE